MTFGQSQASRFHLFTVIVLANRLLAVAVAFILTVQTSFFLFNSWE